MGAVVAETSKHLLAFDLAVVDIAYEGAALVGEAFAEVEEYVALAFGIDKACDGGA